MSTQQVLERCKVVAARAKELYGLDLDNVRISFDLRGRAAGKAGGRGYRLPGSAYYVKFNRDMLTREAFNHVHDSTVPHEYAHVVCYMKPELGKNHDYGWARVCRALGGTGARTHNEEVVFGKGITYEYTTNRGHQVRVSDKRHRYIQGGGTLRYRRGYGEVTQMCAYSIVGHQGRTLEQPIVKQAPNHPAQIETAVRAAAHDEPSAEEMARRAAMVEALRRAQQATRPVQPTFAAGQSKAAISRSIMLSGYRAGHSLETIIQAMITANGYDRQLARATFKANASKVGIPASFY